MNSNIIYHLVTPQWWESQKDNAFYYSPTFKEEQFIHTSTKLQLEATINRYYTNESVMILLHIDIRLLASEVKYEMSTTLMQEFPHIFGGINKDAIVKVEELIKQIELPWQLATN